MTRNHLEVHQPHQKEHVYALKYKDPKLGDCFFIAASGLGDGLTGFVACLVDPVTNMAYPGQLMRTGPRWVFGFFGLPITPKTRYLLFVARTDQSKCGKNVSLMIDIVVDVPHGTFDPIPIQSPASNSTVAANFTAWGTNGPAGTPTNASMAAGANPPAGTVAPIPNPPPGSWLFAFNDVPDDVYTFTVTTGGSTDIGTSINVTVNSDVAPPAPTPPPDPPSPGS
jgi:hypothetical protein